MRSCWKRLPLTAVAAVLFPASALAADAPATPQVAGTFRITIQDSAHRPKPNVRVTLGKSNAYTLRALMRGETSQDGILSFGKIPPGHYTVQLVDPIGEANQMEVDVLAKGGATELPYTWPYVHWIQLPFLTGVLMTGPVPLNHRGLVVRTFPGEALVASTETDLQGAFDIPVTATGRYVVDLSRILPSGVSEPVGRIYAQVTLQGERQKSDPLFVDRVGNGIEYDRFCSLQTVELKESCFQAVSVDDAPLGDAILKVRSDRGFAAAQTYNADAQGIIRLPLLPPGNYQVSLYSKGLTPVRLQVKIGDNTGSCTAPLKIPLNVIGSGCAPSIAGKAN